MNIKHVLVCLFDAWPTKNSNKLLKSQYQIILFDRESAFQLISRYKINCFSV